MPPASRSTAPRCEIDDRLVNLAPGMAVTVEIKTGYTPHHRYLLSPLDAIRPDACASGERLLARRKVRGVQLGNPKQANKREAEGTRRRCGRS